MTLSGTEHLHFLEDNVTDAIYVNILPQILKASAEIYSFTMFYIALLNRERIL